MDRLTLITEDYSPTNSTDVWADGYREGRFYRADDGAWWLTRSKGRVEGPFTSPGRALDALLGISR